MLRSSLLLGLLLLLSGLVVFQCATQKSNDQAFDFEWDMTVENHTGTPKNLYSLDGKHRGMSVFNWRRNIDESINQLIKNNIEWVAIVPFFYQETEWTKTMNGPDEVGVWNRRDSSYINVIHELHKRKVHVFLKPHLWMDEGWRSNITLDTDEEWNIWFESYRRNMVHYAMMANQCGVELLCLGTEFRSSIEKQPDKWDTLIKEIKTIYSGKLTYAANWDSEYAKVQFWDQMDYIGIQAYFPLTGSRNPTLRDVKKGWNPHMKMLKSLSKKHDKPILFSEIGYRSDETATIKPWEWWSPEKDSLNQISFETQYYAYEAAFQELWNEDWFAGMYFWQWHNYSRRNKDENLDFTPRFKPAENTLAKWYGKKAR